MGRITRHQMFMELAHTVAKRATCYRLSVGCVIAIEKRIASYGYNGPGPGEDHCYGATCASEHCTRAIHAEVNALRQLSARDKLARHKVAYLTDSPCFACANELAKARIESVYYQAEYRIKTGVEYLLCAGVNVYRMTKSGLITDVNTGQLVGQE